MLAEHLQTLELEFEPFLEGPAGASFFATSALTQRLDLLQHLIQHSDLLLVLTGPKGAGKTSVLGQVIDSLDPAWSVCPISPGASFGVRALLDRILSGLDVPARGVVDDPPEVRLARLAAHLEGIAAKRGLTVIIVDDADSLEDNALELVAQLAKRSQYLKARLLLAGPASLAERLRKLAAEAGANGTVHPVDLPALTEEQTGDYLHTRLRVAGMRGDSPFAAETIAQIRRDSKGRPTHINALATDALVELAERRTNEVRRSRFTGLLMQWWKGLAVVAVALVLVAMAIIILPSLSSGPSRAVGSPTIVNVTDAPPKAPTATGTETTTGGDAVTRRHRETDRREGRTVMGDPSPPQLDSSADAESSTVSIAMPGAAPIEVPSGLGNKAGQASDPRRAAVPVLAPPTQALLAPAPAQQAALMAATDLPKTRSESPSNPPKDLIKDLGDPGIDPGLDPGIDPGKPQDIAWLRRQRGKDYTLQVMGTHDLPAMRQFLASARLGARSAWFKTTHNGRPWYVVVFGLYPTRDEAAAAIPSLPETLRKGRPWPRTVQSVVAAAG